MKAIGLLLIAAICVGSHFRTAAQELPADVQVTLEALSRLKGINLEQNPGVKGAVLKVSEKLKGRPEAIQIALQFDLSDLAPGVIESALNHPSHELSPQAMRWLAGHKMLGEVMSVLSAAPPKRQEGAIRLLGSLGSAEAVQMVRKLLEKASDPGVIESCIQTLAQSKEGSQELLAWARKLPTADAARVERVQQELSKSRFPEVKEAASQLGVGAPVERPPLPPVAELMKRVGNIERGAKVFRGAATACSACHQIRGEGTDFGPNLSGIGAKLGKDALYEAIIHPSAGISFGFEGWQIETKMDEEAFGIIVSETQEELTLKLQTGLVQKFRKETLSKRQKSELSIMPAGTAEQISVEDLVDLVEYLSSLKGTP